ncbi:hypothetical protein [Nocardioides bruguierae]|uniref:Uncharacterized protein n=1 Tax=Nocardioides bruguierae TaxID=2945102 RepID=A0A9X2IF71_9ACTN|nr:hypothetical protein [Nocardioides bruguierae]MCM0621022.1 hypothetical protein [Nocardioides bruguierae]
MSTTAPDRPQVPEQAAWSALRRWPARRWGVALLTAVAAILVVGLPTDLIPNPVFGREIPPTAWAWPALLVSSVLGGLLAATYVRSPLTVITDDGEDAGPGTRRGWVGGLLTYFAVGCPVCNKLVLLALGSAGAITWFEPVQPVLQVLAVGLLVWALRARLRGEIACASPAR